MKCSVDAPAYSGRCDSEATVFLDYQGSRMAVCSECDAVVGYSKDPDVKVLSEKEFEVFEIQNS